MAMHAAERKARELLAVYGATFVRLSSNGHEIWRLPNGKNWVCPSPQSSTSHRFWNNHLKELERAVHGLSVRRLMTLPPDAEPCPGCHNARKLTDLGLCQECTDNGMPDPTWRPQTTACPPLRPLEVVRPHQPPTVTEKPMAKYVEWTADDDAKLKKLTANGWSPAKIAETLNRTRDAVYKRRSDLKLVKPTRRFTAKDDAKIREALAEGSSVAAIAELVGFSRDSTRKRIHHLQTMVHPKPPSNGDPAQTLAFACANQSNRPAPQTAVQPACRIRLEYPGGQTLEGEVSRAFADDLAIRILHREA